MCLTSTETKRYNYILHNIICPVYSSGLLAPPPSYFNKNKNMRQFGVRMKFKALFTSAMSDKEMTNIYHEYHVSREHYLIGVTKSVLPSLLYFAQ